MGLLAPLGYIVPGIVIDCVMSVSRKAGLSEEPTMFIANMLSAVMASITANILVFHLSGVVLLLYASVSLTSGAVCGLLGSALVPRLRPILRADTGKGEKA